MEKLREEQRARSCHCLGQSVYPAAIQAFEERSPQGMLGGRAGRQLSRPLPVWSYGGTLVVLSSR